MDSPARRPRFAEEDDGLASIACDFNRIPFSSTGRHTAASPVVPCRCTARNAVLRSSSSSPRSVSHPPYFLDACFLCNKPLAFNRDIFMYRGNVAFCSEECRKVEIEADDEKEKSRNLRASMKAMRSSQKVDSTSSPDRSQTRFRAVAAA